MCLQLIRTALALRSLPYPRLLAATVDFRRESQTDNKKIHLYCDVRIVSIFVENFLSITPEGDGYNQVLIFSKSFVHFFLTDSSAAMSI